MRFLRVEVDNWRPFRGPSEIDLAATDGQPITLIFGKNGGGKTSLLTSIYWCLYGRMDLEEGKGDQNLVNDYAVRENKATKQDPVIGSVTLYASHTTSGTTLLYRIRRRQLAYESNGTRRENPLELTVDRITPHQSYRSGDPIVVACNHPDASEEHFDGQHAKQVIENLLPQSLAKYFFYPGETLSFPFKNDQKSRRLLQEFLREISGRSKFAPFVSKLDNTCKTLDAKSQAHARADKATKTLQKEIDDLLEELEANNERLPVVQDELDAAEVNRQAVVEQLQALDDFKEVLATAELARAAEHAAEAAVDRAEQTLSDALGKAYLCVASPVFDAVLDVFGRRTYPNDISSTLVKQMRETMECICGRPLTDEILKRLEPLSPTDDSAIKRMITLTSYASSLRSSDADRTAVDDARVSLNDAIDNRHEAVERRATAEERLADVGAEHFTEVQKVDLVSLRSKYEDDIRGLTGELGGMRTAISKLKADLIKKQDAKTTAAPTTHKNIHHAAALAREMRELLEDIAKKQADVAREQLENLVNENYVVYKEHIYAAVDPEFRVKIFDRTSDAPIEKPIGDLSASETALLTYAFAAAAAKLLPQYQTLDKLLTTTPIFRDVENIPLVVDAPFTNLGHEYKQRVMDLMTKGFSQVVMFTESADTDVLEEAAEKIGMEYLVHYEGDLDENVERTFDWLGNTYTYASQNNESVRSSLERIGG